jgi:hypothetical protein
MSPTRPLLLAVAALLSMAPTAGMAEVYKWVDDDGVTHYSQQPPPEGTPTVITPTADAPSSAESAPDADAAEQDDGSADTEEGDGEQETIADFCEELREREKVLEDDRPIRMKAEDGTLTDLDDEGRAQRLERVQNQLQEHCQGQEAEGGA